MASIKKGKSKRVAAKARAAAKRPAAKAARKKVVKPIPDGYHTVTPYLTVNGAAQAIDFLKTAFGAKEIYRSTRPDGAVGHAQMKVGDSFVMLGEPMGGMTSSPGQLYLYVKDMDTLYRRAMAAGGTSLREPTNEFYGDRVAGVKDPTGNSWWIATHVEDVPSAEMERRAAERMKQMG